MKAKTACRIAARHLVHEILILRNKSAGKFLKHVRDVNSLTIDSKANFGDPSHSFHSEPFYYDTAYLHGFQPTKLTKCLSVENVAPGKAHISEGSACSYVCRTVSDNDVEVILDLKHAFFAEVSEQSQNIDIGCPHVHHLRPKDG